uniref:Uncharacterized protein n=1 Tax=uncultured Sphingobacteriales bacterium HF0130_33B19 TaxID=710991 RepID=E0XTR6_9SPHI|nr:hypothetical protein [uncultured Sphingobacteriales bacterium HF0130_33B19]
MRKLISNILHIKNKFSSWILFFFSLFLVVVPALCILYTIGTEFGVWRLNLNSSFIVSVLTSMFYISLIYVSVLLFIILIFRMSINKTRLLLLAYISISLLIFSIPIFLKYVFSISLIEYLVYVFSEPTRIFDLIIQILPGGFSLEYLKVDFLIKVFMISLTIYISNFLVIKKIFNSNNFLPIKDLIFLNFFMLLLGSIAIIIIFYEAIYPSEYSQYAFLNIVTGPYKFIIIIQLLPVLITQLFWIRKIRSSEFISFVLFLILIPAIFFSLYLDLSVLFSRDYLPASLSMFFPSFLDLGVLLGIIFLPLTSSILFIFFFKKATSFFKFLKVYAMKKDKRVLSLFLFSFILLVFFLISKSFDSIINDLEKDRHNGSLKYVKINQYQINNNGKQMISSSSVKYNLDGNKIEENLPSGDKILFRYENGFLVEKKMFLETRELDRILRYGRDKSGNIITGELIVHNTNDECKRHHYRLDNSGESFMPSEDAYNTLSEEFCDYKEYKFDESGRLSFRGDGTDNSWYYYDGADRLIGENNASKGHPEWDCSFLYNKYSDIVQSSCCCDIDDINEEGVHKTFEYKYDDNGNKISKISFIDGILLEKLTFSYKYDNFNNETEIQYFLVPFPQPYQVDYIKYEYY